MPTSWVEPPECGRTPAQKRMELPGGHSPAPQKCPLPSMVCEQRVSPGCPEVHRGLSLLGESQGGNEGPQQHCPPKRQTSQWTLA